jgi:hypothetical protein
MSYANPSDRNENQRRYRRLNRAVLLSARRGARLLVMYGPAGTPVGWMIDRRTA